MYVYYAHVFWKALWDSALTFNRSAKHDVAILSSSLLKQAHRTSPSSGHASTNSRLPFENPCLPLKGGVRVSPTLFTMNIINYAQWCRDKSGIQFDSIWEIKFNQLIVVKFQTAD